MLDPIWDFLRQFEPEIKLGVSIILGLAGLALAAKPVLKGMSEISNNKWMGGLIWIVAGLAVVAISVGAIYIVYNLGTDTGGGMKQELGLIYQLQNSQLTK